MQYLTISWEMNFYVKNTCLGKVNTKKIFLLISTLLDPSKGP